MTCLVIRGGGRKEGTLYQRSVSDSDKYHTNLQSCHKKENKKMTYNKNMSWCLWFSYGKDEYVNGDSIIGDSIYMIIREILIGMVNMEMMFESHSNE